MSRGSQLNKKTNVDNYSKNYSRFARFSREFNLLRIGTLGRSL